MMLQTDAGLFAVNLESMKVKKFSNVTGLSYYTHHSFTSFFSAGNYHVINFSHRKVELSFSECMIGCWCAFLPIDQQFELSLCQLFIWLLMTLDHIAMLSF
jgi:hypothetical protein